MNILSKENYHAPDVRVLVIQPSDIIAASSGITDTYYGADGFPGIIIGISDGGDF